MSAGQSPGWAVALRASGTLTLDFRPGSKEACAALRSEFTDSPLVKSRLANQGWSRSGAQPGAKGQRGPGRGRAGPEWPWVLQWQCVWEGLANDQSAQKFGLSSGQWWKRWNLGSDQ